MMLEELKDHLSEVLMSLKSHEENRYLKRLKLFIEDYDGSSKEALLSLILARLLIKTNASLSRTSATSYQNNKQLRRKHHSFRIQCQQAQPHCRAAMCSGWVGLMSMCAMSG